MALTSEQEWILVGCGLIAHADEILDIGEWDEVLRYVGSALSETDQLIWMEILSHQDQLERRFAELPPITDEAVKEDVLRRCWQMALADGTGSDVEASVHDQIARRLGVDLEVVARWRESWTQQAHLRAELTVGLAAMFVNLDGHLDFHEAIHFDNLLERLPIPVGRRVELSELLHRPPEYESLVERLMSLDLGERVKALHSLVPILRASRRGGRERELYFDLSRKVLGSQAEAEQLLGST
ncbi:MAG TPA: TerB family tellurite resistance protein [Nannocystis sp.]